VDTVRIAKYSLQNFRIWWKNIHYHLANLWNWITTKNFDVFRIITLKQQTFSQSDPVLIRPKLASVLIQSDQVLIRAHLWCTAEMIGQCFFDIRSYPVFEKWYPILPCFWKMISDPISILVKTLLSISDKYPEVYYDARHTFLCSVYFALWAELGSSELLK